MGESYENGLARVNRFLDDHGMPPELQMAYKQHQQELYWPPDEELHALFEWTTNFVDHNGSEAIRIANERARESIDNWWGRFWTNVLEQMSWGVGDLLTGDVGETS